MSVSPLLTLRHEQDFLLHSLVRFASRSDVHHRGASEVAAGQSLHRCRHRGREHDRLQGRNSQTSQNDKTKTHSYTRLKSLCREHTLVCICVFLIQSSWSSSRGPQLRQCLVSDLSLGCIPESSGRRARSPCRSYDRPRPGPRTCSGPGPGIGSPAHRSNVRESR